MDFKKFWDEPDAIARAGRQIPALTFESTRGSIDLRVFCAERAVIYTYPATGVPGRDPAVDPAPGWDDIPGAPGCTEQSLGFKEHYDQFVNLGVAVAGISTQPLIEQRGFADRHDVPFPLLCDERLALQRAWSLPTFTVGARVFLKRMVLYIEGNELRSAMYPTINPGQSAEAILHALANSRVASAV